MEDVDCIEEHREKQKELIYDVYGLLGIFRSQQEKCMAKHVIITLRDKAFELSWITEMMTPYED